MTKIRSLLPFALRAVSGAAAYYLLLASACAQSNPPGPSDESNVRFHVAADTAPASRSGLFDDDSPPKPDAAAPSRNALFGDGTKAASETTPSIQWHGFARGELAYT